MLDKLMLKNKNYPRVHLYIDEVSSTFDLPCDFDVKDKTVLRNFDFRLLEKRHYVNCLFRFSYNISVRCCLYPHLLHCGLPFWTSWRNT